MVAEIFPVILAGGKGSRLWPLSRKSFPKQFLNVMSDHSLLQETALRVSIPSLFKAPIVICHEEHRFLVAEQLREIDIKPEAIVLEPTGRNTCPAITAIAHLLADIDPSSIMMVMPSDHTITNDQAFQNASRTAVEAAKDGGLVAFGIKPTRPETGFGYIARGRKIQHLDQCFKINNFIEKPNSAAASFYFSDENFYWNSGIFVFTASNFLKECRKFEPAIAKATEHAYKFAEKDLDFLRLAPKPFQSVLSKSVDVGVMEKTKNGIVILADIGWRDLGSWNDIGEAGPKDQHGNTIIGNAEVIDTTHSLIMAKSGMIASIGVQDLAIVATEDTVLVSALERVNEITTIATKFREKELQRNEFNLPVYRPWGTYQTLHSGKNFLIKRLSVNLNASLSLQRHKHRAEHWVVISGTAEVTKDEQTFVLSENESVFLPAMSVHRLKNKGLEQLNIIEVQTGEYLGEDDIERFDDEYGRS